MFVETKECGEISEAPATTLTFSKAIRTGIPHVKESLGYQGCALACASYAVRGYAHTGRLDFWYPEDAARHFNVPDEIASKVSVNHFRGEWTREECADWLEAQGY
jgi:hypothetical protein